MYIRKLFVLLMLLLAISLMVPAAPVQAQSPAYATIAVYVRCASGALPSIGYYQGVWQKDDYSSFLHDLNYDGVFSGYRSYSYVMTVEGNRSWRVKVYGTGGYNSGWSGWQYVSNGYVISWTYYIALSC